MKALRVQYTVKSEFVDQNKKNIQTVMDDLRSDPIENLMYSSFYLGEGKFMHLNVSNDPEANKKLSDRNSFTSFRVALEESQPIAPPKSEDLELVGSNIELI
jgi:hypothetical protein